MSKEDFNRTEEMAKLMMALDFSEEELTLNRNGCLDPNQIKRRNRYFMRDFMGMLGIFAFTAFGCYLVELAGIPQAFTTGFLCLVMGPLTMIIAFIAFPILSFRFKTQWKYDPQEVVGIQGRVQTKKIDAGDTWQYALHIASENRSFSVSYSVYNAFVDGYSYRIYYSPHHYGLILSAEPIVT